MSNIHVKLINLYVKEICDSKIMRKKSKFYDNKTWNYEKKFYLYIFFSKVWENVLKIYKKAVIL